MTIEIIDAKIVKKTTIKGLERGTVMMTVVDVSEEQLQAFERNRADENPREITITFRVNSTTQLNYLYSWFKRQKATEGSKNWGEAIASVIGTIVESPDKRYTEWLF